jgi:hypothetical protein
MSLFCLVHGSYPERASGWQPLVPELEKRGHRTFANRRAGRKRYALCLYARRIPKGQSIRGILWCSGV